MKKFFVLVALCALVSMPVWAGGSDDDKEVTFYPTSKYGKFIRHFHVDKAWKCSANGLNANQTEPTLVDCPGMIAWSIETWRDGNGTTYDYEMNSFKLNLTYVGWDYNKPFVKVNFKVAEAPSDNISSIYQNESNVDNIENYRGCTTYWVYKRFDNGSSQYNLSSCPSGGAYQENYFNTVIGSEISNFLTEHQGNLEVSCDYAWQYKQGKDDVDNGHYYCAIDATDRTRKTFESVTLSNVKFVDANNTSNVQFTIAKNNFGLYLQLWQGSSCISTVDAGTGKSGTYTLNASSVTSDGLENGQYFVRSFPYVRIDQSNYRSGHGCPAEIGGNSYYKDFAAPAVQQPQNTQAVDQHDGTVKVTWKIKTQASGKTYDNTSSWVLERAKSADFTKEYIKKTITFASSTSNYEYIDQVSERDKGKQTYYYRLSRACLNSLYPKTGFQADVNSNYLQVNALTATQNGQNVDLSWTEVPGIWSTGTSMELTYHNGNAQQTITLSKGKCQYTIKDLKSCFPTEFKLQVKNQGTAVSEVSAKFMLRTGERELTDLSVSKGIHNDRVQVRWKVNPNKQDFTYYVLKRKLHQANDNQYEPLTNINHTKGVVQYSYYDKNITPGVYYDYCVEGFVECDEEVSSGGSLADIGFAQSYGVVSGQVTYSGNQAVKDVSVAAIGNDVNVNRSLYFDGNSKVYCGKDFAQQLFDTVGGAVECFFRLEDEVPASVERWIPIHWAGEISINISHTKLYTSVRVGNRYLTPTVNLSDIPGYELGKFNHLVLSFRSNQGVAEVYLYVNGKLMDSQSSTLAAGETLLPPSARNNEFNLGDYNYKGWLDEIRLWSTYRDSADIAQTCDRYLTGNEKGLVAYYRCDDEVAGRLFDMSVNNGEPNEHHLQSIHIITDRNNVPGKEQLALKGVTDENGNYLINAIPYTASGSQYQIVPMKGIHEFSPNSHPLFFNASSSTHNGVNFTDESSFEVRGTVTYEGTTFPVTGCNLYVDGVICTRNNEPVYTGEDGTFIINVPIGKHAITIKREGHTFVNEGRFPTGKEALYDFTEPMNEMDFYDNTEVVLTGRVVGGDIEGDKAHGMYLSKNNIGTAVITLDAGGVYDFNTNTDQVRTFAIPTEASVFSLTQTGKGKTAAGKQITIRTDSTTGEFSVLLPPIDMYVTNVSINTSPAYTDRLNDLTYDMVDLGSANISETTTDSAIINGSHFGFTYLRALDIVLHENPVMKIVQLGAEGNEFGEQYEYISNVEGKIDTIKLYELDANKNASYTYGHPIFLQNQSYAGTVHAYEPYYNKDKDTTVLDQMPFANAIVTVKNELGQKVVAEQDTTIQDSTYMKGSILALNNDQLLLDSTGHATYQFVAGEPNILGDYTLGVTVTYTDAQKSRTYAYDGEEIRGIVFGGINSGSNVVTEGPDMLSYILRDPLGGKSYATWEQGSTVFLSRDMEYNFTNNSGNSENIWGGIKIEFSTGVGVEVVNTTEMIATVIRTADHSNKLHTTYRTYERLVTDHSISTNADNVFVGSMADVFVGKSTNMLFGNMRTVGLVKEGDKYVIGKQDKISTGQTFKTDFVYTQWYIENELIPNYYKLRNALLDVVTESEYQSLDSTCNETDDLKYITALQKTDPHFGDSATYRIIYPKNWRTNGKAAYLDKVQHYNTQVKIWRQQLAFNEEAKVKAIQDQNYLINNVSFDGGDKQTYSTTNTEGTDLTRSTTASESISWSGETGLTINEFGMSIKTSTQQIKEVLNGNSAIHQTHSTLSYTLQGNELEMLSMDVMKDPYGFGPIFSVRGGQTYCPYEDEERTQYYEPGDHVLNTKTVNAAEVKLTAQSYAQTDVPLGTAAAFTLTLSNQSDISSQVLMPVTLYAIEKTNPNGALLYMDGGELNGNGITFFLTPMQSIQKTLYISQGSGDITEYQNIGIGLAPDCMPFRFADTVYLSASYVPTCTPVELKISNRILNSESDTAVHFGITGYDKNFNNLHSIDLQYRSGSDNWKLAQSWVGDPNAVDATHSLIPGGRIDDIFSLNKSIFTDGTYQFRVVSQCTYGNETIDNESEIIDVVRDVTKPQALGQPSPTNGIYTNDNEIYVLLNEPIQTSKVSANNVSVTGMLNAHDVSQHDVAFHYADQIKGYTESQMYLSSDAFSLEMWLRYQKAGTIFYHGKANGLWVDINEQGYLEVGMPTGSIVSKIQVLKDEWCFLLMNMEQNTDSTCTVSLHLAYPDKNFSDQFTMPAYSKTAPIFVGCDGQGDIHDMLLTSTIRSWETASLERNMSKDLYTNAIGYWPMNEGNGKVAKDQLRHRNMVLAADSWWRNGVNYAVHITTPTTIPVNNYTANQNYAIEMWLRMDADGEIFRTSDNSIIFSIANGEYFVVMPNDTITKAAKISFSDGAWHQLTFLGNKSGKSVCIVDGNRVELSHAELLPNILSKALVFGASNAIDLDELRVWNSDVSESWLELNRYTQLGEDALTRYKNRLAVYRSMNDIPEASRAVSAAPLCQPRVQSKVNHSFTTANHVLVINITEPAYRIEGCTLEFCVEGLIDANGNYSTPITWTAYVNRNQLLWSDSEVSIAKENLQEASFMVDVVNNSGQVENWQITNVPEWLSFSETSGIVQPLSEYHLTATVDPALAIGTYEQAIYLSGTQSIHEPLYLNLKVTGDMPEWQINPADYEYTMNMIGVATLNGFAIDDKEDKVAAFVNGKLAGVASPKYNSNYFQFFVMMDIYANLTKEQKNALNHGQDIDLPITFKLWDASTGLVYSGLQTQIDGVNTVLNYAPNTLVGTVTSPVILAAGNKVEQSIALEKGWNWISFNVMDENVPMNEFLKNFVSDITIIKSQTEYAQVDSVRQLLIGSLNTMDAIKSYHTNSSNATTDVVVGYPVNPMMAGIILEPNRWTWIGYIPQMSLSVNAALANLNPIVGDIIKGRTGFATWDGNQWIGSLAAMVPGQGYMYYNSSSQMQTLYYPTSNAIASYAPERGRTSVLALDSAASFTPVAPGTYQNNMTITARIMDGEQVVTDAEVGVFAGQECRAAATAVEGLYFLTVPGEQAIVLNFKVARGNDTIVPEQSVTYMTDAVIGDLYAPYIIQIGEDTGLMNTSDEQGQNGAYKVIINNHVYIVRGGKMTSILGQDCGWQIVD